MQPEDWGSPRLSDDQNAKLRAAVQGVLRRAVDDVLWVRFEYDGTAYETWQQEDRPKAIRELAQKIRFYERKATASPTVRLSQRERRPRGATEKARSDALAALHAHKAGKDARVARFRVGYLADPSVRYDPRSRGGDLPDATFTDPTTWPWCPLPPSRVPEWITEQRSTAPLPEPRRLPAFIDDDIRRAVEYPPGASVSLPFVQAGRFCQVAVATTVNGQHALLAELAELAKILADQWRWHAAQATMFVLTGKPPKVLTAIAGIELNSEAPTASRIVLTVDPPMGAREVAKWYSEVRALIKPPRVRPMNERSYRLAQFMIEHPKDHSERWAAYRTLWNRKYPAWAVATDRIFATRARNALTLLKNPGWHPPRT